MQSHQVFLALSSYGPIALVPHLSSPGKQENSSPTPAFSSKTRCVRKWCETASNMEQEGCQHKLQMPLLRCLTLKLFPVLKDSTRWSSSEQIDLSLQTTLHMQVLLLPGAECVYPLWAVVEGVMENSSEWCVQGKTFTIYSMQGVCLHSPTAGAVCPSKRFPAALSVALDVFCLCL